MGPHCIVIVATYKAYKSLGLLQQMFKHTILPEVKELCSYLINSCETQAIIYCSSAIVKICFNKRYFIVLEGLAKFKLNDRS